MGKAAWLRGDERKRRTIPRHSTCLFQENNSQSVIEHVVAEQGRFRVLMLKLLMQFHVQLTFWPITVATRDVDSRSIFDDVIALTFFTRELKRL